MNDFLLQDSDGTHVSFKPVGMEQGRNSFRLDILQA